MELHNFSRVKKSQGKLKKQRLTSDNAVNMVSTQSPLPSAWER